MAEPGEGHEARGPGGAQKGNLVDLYEKMSKILGENLDRAGMITEEAFELALKESREWAQKMKEDYGEDIAKVSDFIRRDWHEAIRHIRQQAQKSLGIGRIQVGLLEVLSRMAESAGSQLEIFANKLKERLTYKTGEIAGAGSLECQNCEQMLEFEKPTRIPPCPKCRGTIFSRRF
ncbi:MAG: hypothetical protein O7E56_08530 [SAR324 cluster bacterium]|nr:hypothetical protein [SAR324 cluster bacterium]